MFDFDHNDFHARLLGDHRATPAEYMIQPGDSGGGVFAEVDGEWRLIAISSFAMDRSALIPGNDIGAAVGLADHYDWIESVMHGFDPVALPEPASLTMLAMVGTFCCLRRRMRR